MSPLFLVLGAGAVLLLIQRQSSARTTATTGPVTLEVGIPYRITVRAAVGDSSPAVLARAESAARASITASGGSDITISRAGSTLVIAYRSVPVKAATYQVGVDGGNGHILSVTRLDGRPLR